MSPSPRTLSIWFLGLFVVLLAVLCLWLFWPFLTPIAWALIFWRLLYHPHERLVSLTRGRRTVSATILTVGVMALIVLPLSYLSAVAGSELMHLYQLGQDWLRSGGLAKLPETVAQLPFLGSVSQEFLGQVIAAYGPIDTPRDGTSIGSVAGSVGDVAKQIVDGLTTFLMTMFTLFFLFRDSPSLSKAVSEAFPIDKKVKRQIYTCLDEAVTAIVRGTLLTAGAQGLVAGVTYWLLDLPVPLLLGALSALVSLLPMGGTALIWGPLAVYLLVTGAVWKGLILLTVGIGIVGLMDNVLQPFLVGTGVDLPLILVFFASLGGLTCFGFIGLFVGPIILALTKATLHICVRAYRQSLVSTHADAIGH
jgi:predicted PurR-regulated permease PerM